MSFNNGPYIFSDVPGYEATKGERIVKAFRKLQAKINDLERAKILEKNIQSQEFQASSQTDLTISDIKYQILLTQLHYIIKIIREYANDKSSKSVYKDLSEESTGYVLKSSSNNFRPMHEGPDVQYEHSKNNIPSSSIPKVATEESHHESRQININDHQVSTTGTQTSIKENGSNTTEKLLQDHSRPDSHSHYHLNLNDVPFILGASSSASHSVVANVQNIIALMKSHNKVLCASKTHIQKDANSAKVCKADTQDANKMLQELTEDLSKLTKKQERLQTMFDNANPHSNDAKVTTSQHFDTGNQKKCKVSNNGGDIGQGTATGVLQKNSKQQQRKKPGNQGKHIVPTVRMQSNECPQLVRRKILLSLKDIKTHLSEEDLSWK